MLVIRRGNQRPFYQIPVQCTIPDPSPACPGMAKLLLYLLNANMFGGISSMTSSAAPSKRTSIFATPALVAASEQPIPTLTTTTLDCSCQQTTKLPRTMTHVGMSGFSLRSEGGNNRSARFLQSLFAPISTFQRRRKRTKAERRAHKVSQLVSWSIFQLYSRSKIQAFRTITFIVGLFAILWSPYYVVVSFALFLIPANFRKHLLLFFQATIYGFCHGDCIPGFIYNISYYMCYLNSALNPFAYALGQSVILCI